MAPPRSSFTPDHVAGVPDRWLRAVVRIADGIIGVTAADRLAHSVADRGSASACAQALLEALNIRVCWHGEPLQQVASPGPLLIVGNHPFGVLDGLLSMALLPPLRPDVKFMAQHPWQRMPNAGTAVLPLWPTNGHRFADANARSLRAALNWVRSGHALGLFPAPHVATWTWSTGRVTDPPWSNFAGVMVARARADVLPVHLAGRNSLAFLATAALLDPLQHALLIREFFNKRNRTIDVTVGRRLRAQDLGHGDDPQVLTRRIRERVYALAASR